MLHDPGAEPGTEGESKRGPLDYAAAETHA
jgi:hypothetical protein